MSEILGVISITPCLSSPNRLPLVYPLPAIPPRVPLPVMDFHSCPYPLVYSLPPSCNPSLLVSPRHLPSLRLPPPSRLPPARKQFIPPTLKLAGQWPGYKAARKRPLLLAAAAALIWSGLRRRDDPESRCQLSPDCHNSHGHCYLIHSKTIKACT